MKTWIGAGLLLASLMITGCADNGYYGRGYRYDRDYRYRNYRDHYDRHRHHDRRYDRDNRRYDRDNPRYR